MTTEHKLYPMAQLLRTPVIGSIPIINHILTIVVGNTSSNNHLTICTSALSTFDMHRQEQHKSILVLENNCSFFMS